MCNKSDAKNNIEDVRKGLVKGWVVSQCKHCGNDYAQQKSRVRRNKYCSKSCKDDFFNERKSRREVGCKRCGEVFVARNSQLANGVTPYCSISCVSKSQERTKERYQKISDSIKKNKDKHNYRKGEEVHNWNGGITINRDGYILQRIDGKQVLQHRHFMELHLERKLDSSEIVHHINEVKDDNRIENLQIMSRSEHAKHHDNYRGIEGRFK